MGSWYVARSIDQNLDFPPNHEVILRLLYTYIACWLRFKSWKGCCSCAGPGLEGRTRWEGLSIMATEGHHASLIGDMDLNHTLLAPPDRFDETSNGAKSVSNCIEINSDYFRMFKFKVSSTFS